MNLDNYFTQKDKEGNEIKCVKGVITFKGKRIGEVYQDTQSTPHLRKSVKEVNRFRKNNSWGLNWATISKLFDDSKVTLHSDDGTIYMTTKKDIDKYGEFLFFKEKGFERQIFIPIENMIVSE